MATTSPPNRLLSITATGYAVSSAGNYVVYALTIRNENPAEAAESVSIQVSFENGSGTVLGTHQNSIAVLGPGEHIGSAGVVFVEPRPDMKMVVQALPGKWTAIAPIPSFTFSKTTYIDDSFFPRVTGTIRSPFARDARQVKVTAIGVDSRGDIVGAGFTFVDFVPANGTAAVSVPFVGPRPATAVLYGELTSISLIGN